MVKWILLQERGEAYWPLGPAAITLLSSYTKDVETVLGAAYRESVMVSLPRHQYYYFPIDTWKAVDEHVLARVEKKPELVSETRKKFESMIPAFRRLSSLLAAPLSKKTNGELWALYSDYSKTYREVYVWSEPLPFAIRESLFNKLEEYLKRLLQPRGEEKKFGEYFSLLTSQKEKTFTTREEEGLLKILALIQSEECLAKAFSGKSDEAFEAEAEKHPKIKELIEKHATEFAWIPFDYGLEVWPKAHFVAALNALIKNGFNAAKRLDDIDGYYSALEKKQEKLFSELGVDDYHRSLFKAAQDCAFIIDFKKEEFTKSHVALQNLLDEIQRRLQLTKLAMRYTTMEEVEEGLRNGAKFDSAKLEERSRNSIFYTSEGKYRVIEGADVAKWLVKQGLKASAQSETLEVKGTCACGGTAIGSAKIVHSAKELSKLGKGDVLVTYQTSPDFVHGMKRAAAIVTNEGGLTCHAAIVARELGVPCVVGTQIATKVFKDGDTLEVKASHGVVRKIK